MTDYSIKQTGMKGKPLCTLNGDLLLCYYRGQLIIYATGTQQKFKKIKLPNQTWRRMACKCRLLERLLHNDARWAMELDEKHVLLEYRKHIYTLNLETGVLDQEQVEFEGHPLMCACIQNIKGFENSFVIGDYGGNPERKKVNIYQRVDGKWNICHTFDEGSVRHIHGFFPDPENDRVFILTGDLDNESGIWEARNNFSEVRPYLLGKQQYRCCQMLISGNAIYFMTDAPSEPNYIYRVENEQLTKLDEISGTCIYGTQTADVGVFSTTCEADAIIENRVLYWLSNKPGKGIKGRTIDLFSLTKAGEYKKLAEFKHDGLPLRLLQYARIAFANSNDEEAVFFSPQCVKKYDNRIFVLDAHGE